MTMKAPSRKGASRSVGGRASAAPAACDTGREGGTIAGRYKGGDMASVARKRAGWVVRVTALGVLVIGVPEGISIPTA
jgi:hypothetical protein